MNFSSKLDCPFFKFYQSLRRLPELILICSLNVSRIRDMLIPFMFTGINPQNDFIIHFLMLYIVKFGIDCPHKILCVLISNMGVSGIKDLTLMRSFMGSSHNLAASFMYQTQNSACRLFLVISSASMS